MKILTIITCIGIVGLAALGVAMAKTNPTEAEYEEYAVRRLSRYLDKNVCNKAPSLLENLIRLNCKKLVSSANPEIRKIIADSTYRQDFIIFSVYRTDLKINSWLPSYKSETIGALESFYTYNTRQE